jgi:RNA polymerase sigma-70 factor (sigma-E family)
VAEDTDEFAEFVAARSSPLLRLACLLTGGDRLAAEDLLQDAFTETFIRWRRIREPAGRDAYVRRILVRSATRRWRKRDRHMESSSDKVPEPSVDSQTDRIIDSHAVWTCLSRLPPRQRAVVVLRYYEDLSELQTAELLGCATGTVKSHAARGLRALHRDLQECGYLTPKNTGGKDHDPST